MKFASFINGARETADALYKTSAALGLGVNKLRAYNLAWSEAGVASKTTEKILSKVSELLQKAKLGDASAIRFLTESGIDPLNDSLETTIEKLQESGNASLIFAGKNLLAFNKITVAGADVNKRLQEMGEDGLLFTNKSGDAFQKLNDNMAEFEEKIVVFLTNILGNEDFIKGLESLLKGFSEIFKVLTDGEEGLSILNIAMKIFAFSMRNLTIFIKLALIPIKIFFAALKAVIKVDGKIFFKAWKDGLTESAELTKQLALNTVDLVTEFTNNEAALDSQVQMMQTYNRVTKVAETTVEDLAKALGKATGNAFGFREEIKITSDETEKNKKIIEAIITPLDEMITKLKQEAKDRKKNYDVLKLQSQALMILLRNTKLSAIVMQGYKQDLENVNKELDKMLGIKIDVVVLDFAANEIKKIDDLREEYDKLGKEMWDRTWRLSSYIQKNRDLEEGAEGKFSEKQIEYIKEKYNVWEFYAERRRINIKKDLKLLEEEKRIFEEAADFVLANAPMDFSSGIPTEGAIRVWQLFHKTAESVSLVKAQIKNLDEEIKLYETTIFKAYATDKEGLEIVLGLYAKLIEKRNKLDTSPFIGPLPEGEGKPIIPDETFADFYEKWNEVIAQTAEFINETFTLMSGLFDNAALGYEMELEHIRELMELENERWQASNSFLPLF